MNHHNHETHRSWGRAFSPSLNSILAITTALNLSFVVVEFTFGVMTNSKALLADAGHNFQTRWACF